MGMNADKTETTRKEQLGNMLNGPANAAAPQRHANLNSNSFTFGSE